MQLTIMSFFIVAGFVLNLLLILEFFRMFVYKKGAAYIGTAYLNSNPKAIAELIDELARGQESVHMVSGNGDHRVYNDDRLKQAFREFIKRKGHDVKVIIGPNISRSNGENGLVDLAEEGVVRLLILENKPKIHFRIVDGKAKNPCVYVEEREHQDDQEERVVRIMRGATLAARKLEGVFESLEHQARPYQEQLHTSAIS